MEMLQLKYFCDAAVTQNFSKTAERFFVPPSSVSQSIRRLENELGMELFERKANRVILNEEGEIFYQAVTECGKILLNAEKQVTDGKKEICGEIKLQIFCNRRIISEAIGEFTRKYPEVSFVLNHGFPTDEDFDLIISDKNNGGDSWVSTPLLEEEIALAVSKTHPISNKKKFSLNELKNERFITTQSGSSFNRLSHQLCNNAGFEPHIAIECDDPLYIRKYIEMGLGIGFVPMFSWKGQFSKDLALKVIPGYKRVTNVYYNKESYITRTTRKFLEHLIEFCKKQDI